jgi:hypothetical protein
MFNLVIRYLTMESKTRSDRVIVSWKNVPGAAKAPGGQANLSTVALEEDGAAGITLFNHEFSFEIVSRC